jgi:hypothetical protein
LRGLHAIGFSTNMPLQKSKIALRKTHLKPPLFEKVPL